MTGIRIEVHQTLKKTICSGPIITTMTIIGDLNPFLEKIKCTNLIHQTLTSGQTQGSTNQLQAPISVGSKLLPPFLNFETT